MDQLPNQFVLSVCWTAEGVWLWDLDSDLGLEFGWWLWLLCSDALNTHKQPNLDEVNFPALGMENFSSLQVLKSLPILWQISQSDLSDLSSACLYASMASLCLPSKNLEFIKLILALKIKNFSGAYFYQVFYSILRENLKIKKFWRD